MLKNRRFGEHVNTAFRDYNYGNTARKLYCEKEHLLSHRSPARTIIQRKKRVIELNRELFIFVICMLLPRRQTLWMVKKLRPEKLTLCAPLKLRTRKI